MIAFFRKPYRWAWVYAAVLAAAFVFALLDAFVIPKTLTPALELPASASAAPSEEARPPAETQPPVVRVEAAPPKGESAVAEPDAANIPEEAPPSEPIITDTTYADEHIQITVETVREYDTTFYVADIQLSDAACLKTALARGTYGRNIKETTSAIAEANSAIFAINGDYYGFRDTGCVLRNGELYRGGGSGDALLIDRGGDFSIVEQSGLSEEALQTAWQILSFGPALVEDGAVVVDEGSEVSRSRSSNPRTAIGQIGPLHYIAIVSDGRTDESEGLSLLQLARELAERGAVVAYNLDGGGSSTMVLNGRVINTPTSGRSWGEREVSDIVYIGYA